MSTIPRSTSCTVRQHCTIFDIRAHCSVSTRLGAQIPIRCHLPTRGSSTASTIFFDESADLLNLTTSYSSVVVMGDVNLHLDMQTASSNSSFSSLLAANNLVQVVQSPTHTAGHLLDIVAVGSGTAVTSVNVPPPFLSDHSMIDVALDLCCANHHGFRHSYRHSY